MQITNQKQLNGMALGGLGTGSIEIMPDGCFDNWQIFNLGKWVCTDPEKYNKKDPENYGNDVLKFYVRTESDGKITVRKLSHDNSPSLFRNVMYSFLKNIEEIKWEPDFPVCKSEYTDSALPVKINAEYISPFLPHDSKFSGTPGFYINYKITNTSDKNINVSLLGTMKSPLKKGNNTLYEEDGRTLIQMKSDSEDIPELNGSICIGASGGKNTSIESEYAAFFGAYVFGGQLGVSEESALFDFKKYGRFEKPEYNEFAKTPGEYRVYKRIEATTPEFFETEEGIAKYREAIEDNKEDVESSGTGCAVCSEITLAPGETKEILYTLSWYFPNHNSVKTGKLIGHKYTTFLSDAKDAADLLYKERLGAMLKIKEFAGLVNSCGVYSKAWSAQLSTLVKCSWWAKNGNFGIWEGLGSCGFNTTDIMYYASFMLSALFPDIFKKMLQMGLPFQKDDGRVYHFFTPDFDHVDDSFERVDMNEQFVQMVCLNYIMTGDDEFLDEMWCPVKKAMSFIEQLDTNGDGLPDKDTGKSSYDAWKMRGTPSYIAMLWLGALNSAIYLAEKAGDPETKAHYEEILEKGKTGIYALWNGEYFNLWNDTDRNDPCCMSGQLDGLWFNKLAGLCDVIDETTVRTALKNIFRYNYTEDCGLVNATYPDDSLATLFTYQNVQAEANWSGIEYAFASMLLEYGEKEKAETITSDVVCRYEKVGRIFNHEECGGHYFRPLSAWAIMMSLSGFRYNHAEKKLTLTPGGDMKCPWFTPYGYGTMTVNGNMIEIEVTDGKLECDTVDCSGNFSVSIKTR